MRLVLKQFFSTEKVAVDVSFHEPDGSSHPDSADQPQGVHCKLGNNCVGLFVVGEKLFLFLNGFASEVREQLVMASFRQEGVRRRLELTTCGVTTIVVYNNAQLPISTQFYSEDDEDCDFGLWLTNVLGSDLRRKTFLRSWRKT